MWQVQTTRLALNDSQLFLDTHPDNKLALEYFNASLKAFSDALAAYQKTYGPITLYHGGMQDQWQWTSTPWPWEKEGK